MDRLVGDEMGSWMVVGWCGGCDDMLGGREDGKGNLWGGWVGGGVTGWVIGWRCGLEVENITHLVVVGGGGVGLGWGMAGEMRHNGGDEVVAEVCLEDHRLGEDVSDGLVFGIVHSNDVVHSIPGSEPVGDGGGGRLILWRDVPTKVASLRIFESTLGTCIIPKDNEKVGPASPVMGGVERELIGSTNGMDKHPYALDVACVGGLTVVLEGVVGIHKVVSSVNLEVVSHVLGVLFHVLLHRCGVGSSSTDLFNFKYHVVAESLADEGVDASASPAGGGGLGAGGGFCHEKTSEIVVHGKATW